MHVSYLTLIAGVHRTIRVTLTVDFTLLQVTLVSGFSVARMTAACETTERVRASVLAWTVLTLVHICKEEKQFLWKSMDGILFYYGSTKKVQSVSDVCAGVNAITFLYDFSRWLKQVSNSFQDFD